MVLQEPWRQAHLAELTQQLCRGLGLHSGSPIVPLLVGSEANALAVSADLLQRGFYVPAVRPPTVPPGTCRYAASALLKMPLRSGEAVPECSCQAGTGFARYSDCKDLASRQLALLLMRSEHSTCVRSAVGTAAEHAGLSWSRLCPRTMHDVSRLCLGSCPCCSNQ